MERPHPGTFLPETLSALLDAKRFFFAKPFSANT
jgi:hypothetical protein